MKVQIILAGIGGQGVLFSSRVFSELGLQLGLNVMGSETHGMSQRGGSVIAHLKLGGFQSPLIRCGTADILYSLDKNEAYRTLKFLREGGLCFVNQEKGKEFDKKVLSYLRKKNIAFHVYDATEAALKIGSILATNIILIGYSVGTGLVPFKHKDFKKALELTSKQKNLALNLKAFEFGFREGKLA